MEKFFKIVRKSHIRSLAKQDILIFTSGRFQITAVRFNFKCIKKQYK